MDHIGAQLDNTKRNIEIVGADLVSLHGFTQVPNFILTNKELSVGAKLYYAMLLKSAREKLSSSSSCVIHFMPSSTFCFATTSRIPAPDFLAAVT